MNRDGYRDQIVTHDVGVSLHSKTHPLFMKFSNGTITVLCISLSELVSCAFSTIPICPFLIPGIFHIYTFTQAHYLPLFPPELPSFLDPYLPCSEPVPARLCLSSLAACHLGQQSFYQHMHSYWIPTCSYVRLCGAWCHTASVVTVD